VQYRTFGMLDWRPSALGFGAMRLPLLPADPGAVRPDASRIDYPAATAMLRWAIDHGVNYVDTAYIYHGGASETWLAQALEGGYRDKVKVATKLPIWEVKEAADLDRLLDEQRERLRMERIDCYLLHGLDAEAWDKVEALGVLEWGAGALADGRIAYFGFSFHDEHGVFRRIVDAGAGLWSFCQIQYNYMDAEFQAGKRGLEYAAAQGLAVIVMEPIRGGMLAHKAPPRVARLWEQAPVRRSQADWALQWVWNHPEVSLVLSGMSSMRQVRQNVTSAERSGVGTLGEEELAVVAQVRDAYREFIVIPCTDCKYCLPCPSGVNIPGVFSVYNDAKMYGDRQRARLFYGWLDESERAHQCTRCGRCEELCPQGIGIMGWLEKAQAFLAVEKGQAG